MSASVKGDGGSVYAMQLTNFEPGMPITVTMSGTQYLPAGVYFTRKKSDEE